MAAFALAFAILLVGCGPGLVQTDFLIHWSQDGGRAAIAPWPFENQEDTEPGLWILDTARGELEKILSPGENRYCFHPQWSPHADELVFGIIKVKGNEPVMEGGAIPFTVWITDSHGKVVRKIAETSCSEDAFLIPNLISWGGYPGTLLYPQQVGGKMTAVHLDLNGMKTSRFLPEPATAYLLRFSPDRDKVAALLYQEDSHTADVYLGDIPLGLWWKLDSVPCGEEALELPDPVIYWSPDGARFAVPSLKRLNGRHFIHIYDSLSRRSARIEADPPETGLFWNADGSALAYTAASGAARIHPPGLYRIDIRRGKLDPLLLLEDYHALSWNRSDDRIYLIHESKKGGKTKSPALSSCSPAGMDARWLVAPPLSGDWGWHASPLGDKLLFITVHSEVRLLHLDTGFLTPALKLR
jgi:Tol biopolymer transport system component